MTSRFSRITYGLVWVLLLFILLCPICCYGAEPFPRPQGLVNDFANVISPQYEEKLAQITSELLKKTEVPVVVVTMPDIGGEDYNEYAARLYEAWGIGKKGVDKGVLIFVTLKERKMRIETGYGERACRLFLRLCSSGLGCEFAGIQALACAGQASAAASLVQGLGQVRETSPGRHRIVH